MCAKIGHAMHFLGPQIFPCQNIFLLGRLAGSWQAPERAGRNPEWSSDQIIWLVWFALSVWAAGLD